MRVWFKGVALGQRGSRHLPRDRGPEAPGSGPATEPSPDLVESVFQQFQRLDDRQRARVWQRIWCCKTGTPDLTVDEVILKALESGQSVTINDITKCFVDRVRTRLEKLRLRGVVTREGRGGAHREFTYRLVRPDRVAKAICEAGGGLSRVAKSAAERRGI
jgi:hypothetical protein